MGKHFKLTQNSKKIVKKNEDDIVKIVYDHRPIIKTNPKLIEEFKKNMKIPSLLWDGPTVFKESS